VVELRFELEKSADVSLRIYDVAGRLVTTLADARLPAGRHDLSWTGCTSRGEPAAAGVYFARLESSETNSVRRLVRVR
jgi:flagellar hook assembly protein FlgD